MPNPFDQFDGGDIPNPFDQFDGGRGEGAPTPGGLNDVAGGMVNTILAGLQKTSPVMNKDYVPLGELSNTEGPNGYGYYSQNGSGEFDPNTMVMLRDPQTGKIMVYGRSPKTDEGTLSALGHVIGGSALPAPTRLAGAAPMTTAQELGMAFRNAQVQPTMAMLSPTRTQQIAASLLRSVPGAASVEANAEQRVVNQTAAAAQRAADAAGTARGDVGAGRILQNDAAAFAGRSNPAGMTNAEVIASPSRASSFGTKADALYEAVPISKGQTVALNHTEVALDGLTNKFTSSPELGKLLTPPIFGKYLQAIAKTGTLTWDEIKAFRSAIGRQLGDPSLISDAPRADLKQLYAALSQDMGIAAKQAGPDAARLFDRANKYYEAGLGRIEKLTSIFDAKSPEAAFGQLVAAARSGKGGDISKILALKRSMPAEDWNDMAASVLGELGNARPGKVTNLPGVSNFSMATWSTNWNSLSDAAKDALYGTGTKLRGSLEDLAKVTGSYKSLQAAGNPSGTGPVTIAAGAAAAAAGSPAAIAKLVGLVGGGYMTAKLLTYEPMVRWLVAANRPSQSLAQTISRVGVLKRMADSAPPEVRDDVQRMADKVLEKVRPYVGGSPASKLPPPMPSGYQQPFSGNSFTGAP